MVFIVNFSRTSFALLKNVLLLIMLLALKISDAQIIDTSYLKVNEIHNGIIYFKKNPLTSDKQFIDAEVFNLPNCQYKLAKQMNFGESDKHYKYQLYHKGYLVQGYELVIHIVGENITGTGSVPSSTFDINVASNISNESAISIALNDVNAEKYAWQDSIRELAIKEAQNDSTASYYPKPEFVIMNGTLCKRVKVFARTPLATYDYYINAQSGSIVKKDLKSSSGCYSHDTNSKAAQQIDQCELGFNTKTNAFVANTGCSSGCNAGSADLEYYGTQNLNSDRFLNFWAVCQNKTKDPCGSPFIYVRKANTSLNFNYTNSTGNWGTTNHSGTNPLWIMRRVTDYYANHFNRLSYDDAGAQVNVFADDPNASAGVANWDGTSINIGYNTTSNGFFSRQHVIDILAHEFTHAVNDNTAMLPNTGEGGAINESLADIFGIAIDNNVKANFNTGVAIDYILANEASNSTRSLANPNGSQKPDCFGGQFYVTPTTPYTTGNDMGGVHTNLGVLDFWFFLLAEGSNGPQLNDLNQTYCVKPLGQERAIQIVYKALAGGYYTSTTTFNSFAAQTILAASDKHGFFSPEVAEVVAAFHAVGLSQTPNLVLPFVFVGNRTESNNNVGYHFNAEVRHQNYTATFGATVDVTSATEIILLPNTNLNNGIRYDGHIANACSANGASGAKTINNSSGSNGSVAVKDENLIQSILAVENNFDIIPNPSNGKVMIALNNSEMLPSSIELIDILGNKVAIVESPLTKEIHFDMTNNSNGIYFVKVNYRGAVVSKKLVKN
ncbi:MAG: M4 family metallopeptidase [Bacteroidia bacterium]|nr:M4 family metallopeptidase [Bacteroidia bacterium]